MYRVTKNIVIILIFVCLLFPVFVLADEATNTVRKFSDIPESHYAYNAVHELRKLQITDGYPDNSFGLGKPIKRNEFVKFLVSLMNWELVIPEKGSFSDNQDKSKWYFKYIETALTNNMIIKDSNYFRSDENITREEIAVMIVRALGYDTLAKQLNILGSPFDDVKNYTGYITIARDLGIVSGVGNNLFQPKDNALREQAAAMIMRMYGKLQNNLNELHAFYAINSSPQKDMINQFDSVSFGWSFLDYDAQEKKVFINTSFPNKYSFYIPDKFSERVNKAKQNNVSTQLMVFASQEDKVYIEQNVHGVGLIEYILTDESKRSKVIEDIVNQVNNSSKNDESVSFNGVVIDFECIKGEKLKQLFNVFLKELKESLDKSSKKLYVTVHPKRITGQIYYDGYDYKVIGEIADKIILMAHDYNSVKLNEQEMQNGYTDTPLTPVNEVYYALKSITDKNTGVDDISKIWLQLSFDSVQWKIKDGNVINQNAYKPDYEAIKQRLQGNTEIKYSTFLENPYAKFYDENDNTNNIIWYEDTRSVAAKIKLAKMFGIQGISIWRLGIIPDFDDNEIKKIYLDIWPQILKNAGKNDTLEPVN